MPGGASFLIRGRGQEGLRRTRLRDQTGSLTPQTLLLTMASQHGFQVLGVRGCLERRGQAQILSAPEHGDSPQLGQCPGPEITTAVRRHGAKIRITAKQMLLAGRCSAICYPAQALAREGPWWKPPATPAQVTGSRATTPRRACPRRDGGGWHPTR